MTGKALGGSLLLHALGFILLGLSVGRDPQGTAPSTRSGSGTVEVSRHRSESPAQSQRSTPSPARKAAPAPSGSDSTPSEESNPTLSSPAEGETPALPQLPAVRARVQKALRYPGTAWATRSQGRTVLSAEIAADGSLSSLETRESSGRNDLDQAAIRAFQASAPFPENTTGRKIRILLPVEFKLPD